MALPMGRLVKAVLGGAMATDTWSCGIWMDGSAIGGSPTAPQMNTFSNTVFSLFDTTVWSASSNPYKARCATGTTLASVKTYFYASGALFQQGQSSNTVVAATGSTPHPAYVACCVTIATAYAGRSNRGRMYLPATAFAVDPTTLQFGTGVSDVATKIAAFLTALNGTALNGGAPVVSIVSSTHGLVQRVSNVRCDSIPDTQHGRSNKFIAQYAGTATV